MDILELLEDWSALPKAERRLMSPAIFDRMMASYGCHRCSGTGIVYEEQLFAGDPCPDCAKRRNAQRIGKRIGRVMDSWTQP